MSARAIEARSVVEYVDHVLGFFTEAGRGRPAFVIAASLAFVAGMSSAVIDGTIAVALVGLGVVTIMTWVHPPLAGYAMVAAAPAIVGLDRDQVLPFLRPNEALLGVLIVILATRWLLYSRKVDVRLNAVDVTMVGLVATGFAIPLIAQVVRLRPMGLDDILYALVFVRLGLLYGLIRHTIRTPGQVRTAIGFSLATASVLGLLGLMDSLNLLDTAERLNPYFPNAGPVADDGRGAASIGNPIGFGVYAAINCCLGLAMLLGGERPVVPLALATACCGLGVFGSGQIGPTLSFVVGLVVLAVLTRSVMRLTAWLAPAVLVVLVVVSPLILRRIDGFGGFEVTSATRQAIAEAGGQEESRLLFDANPGSSWDVRLYNLETFFIPEFNDPLNVALGVTPQARVPSPREGEDFIWIESGHLWLVWSGGIPLFIAFFGFIGVGMYTAARVSRSMVGPVGIAAVAFVAALSMLFVAQTFDPHLTLRGTADILYPLAALATTGWSAARARPHLVKDHIHV
ncbi:MAG: hypothetical protein AAF467_07695 [Actinomycetota bacterium]